MGRLHLKHPSSGRPSVSFFAFHPAMSGTRSLELQGADGCGSQEGCGEVCARNTDCEHCLSMQIQGSRALAWAWACGVSDASVIASIRRAKEASHQICWWLAFHAHLSVGSETSVTTSRLSPRGARVEACAWIHTPLFPNRPN